MEFDSVMSFVLRIRLQNTLLDRFKMHVHSNKQYYQMNHGATLQSRISPRRIFTFLTSMNQQASNAEDKHQLLDTENKVCIIQICIMQMLLNDTIP